MLVIYASEKTELLTNGIFLGKEDNDVSCMEDRRSISNCNVIGIEITKNRKDVKVNKKES